MAPFYEEVCRDLGWKLDQSLLTKMKEANEVKIKELDSAIEDAENNLGETEVRDTMLRKAEYYSMIGAKVCFRLNRTPLNNSYRCRNKFSASTGKSGRKP